MDKVWQGLGALAALAVGIWVLIAVAIPGGKIVSRYIDPDAGQSANYGGGGGGGFRNADLRQNVRPPNVINRQDAVRRGCRNGGPNGHGGIHWIC